MGCRRSRNNGTKRHHNELIPLGMQNTLSPSWVPSGNTPEKSLTHSKPPTTGQTEQYHKPTDMSAEKEEKTTQGAATSRGSKSKPKRGAQRRDDVSVSEPGCNSTHGARSTWTWSMPQLTIPNIDRVAPSSIFEIGHFQHQTQMKRLYQWVGGKDLRRCQGNVWERVPPKLIS